MRIKRRQKKWFQQQSAYNSLKKNEPQTVILDQKTFASPQHIDEIQNNSKQKMVCIFAHLIRLTCADFEISSHCLLSFSGRKKTGGSDHSVSDV